MNLSKGLLAIAMALLAESVMAQAPARGAFLADQKLLPKAAADYLLDGPSMYKINRRAKDLIVEDLNGDGLPDISVTANERSMLELFLRREKVADGEQAYERQEVTLDRIIRSVVSTDVNGDGRMDLLMAATPPKLVVMYQGKDGRLAPVSELELEAERLILGDLNGDGRKDVLVYNDRRFQILTAESRGVNLIPSATFHTTGIPASDMMILDFDGDGRQDIVYHDSQRFQDLVVRLQSPEGTFPVEFRVTSGMMRTVAPLPGLKNQQGTVLAIQNTTRQITQLALAEPTKTTTQGQALALSSLHSIPFSPELRARRSIPTVADYNGDGRQDLLIASPDLSVLRVLRQNKSGALVEATIPSLQGLESVIPIPGKRGEPAPLLFFSPEEKTIGFATADGKTGQLPFPRLLAIEGTPQGVTLVGRQKDTPLLVVYTTTGTNEFALLGYPITADGKLGEKVALITKEEGGKWPFDGMVVKGLDAMDVNQDGLQDLIVYIDFKPAQVLLQQKDGKFRQLKGGSAILEGLLSGAKPGALVAGKLTPKAETHSILALKEKFVRAFTIDKDENVVVEHQFNGRNNASRLLDVAVGALTSEDSVEVVLLDRGNKCLTVYTMNKEKSFEIIANIAFDDANYSSVKMLDLDGDNRDDILLIADDRLGILFSQPTHGGLSTLATATTGVTDGGYGKIYTADLIPGDSLELVSVEMKENLMEIFVAGKNADKQSDLLRFYQFMMFDSESSLARYSNLDAQPEPRELVATDLDGDGRPEIISLMHDNLVIYTPIDRDEKPKAEQ